MYTFEVGKLFQENITKYEECMKFGFGQNGSDMSIFLNRTTDREIDSIKSGKLELAFYEKDGIIFFLSKFQGMNWMDAPYTVHLSQPFEFLDIPADSGFSLSVFLVNAATGILKVNRFIGLGHKFSQELKTAILKQKQLPFNRVSYNDNLQAIYRNYSTSDFVKRANHFFKVK